MKPTMQLRFVNRIIYENVVEKLYQPTLQQLWCDDDGTESEWRDVPSVAEEMK